MQGIADEIVVVDSFSTDNTEEICKKYGVIFLQQAWLGYSETKNFGNAKASNDWIISLDADEVLSTSLRQSILDLKKSLSADRQDGPQNYFYSFNRLSNYCGQWIRHGGWYPDTKLRLFDRRVAHWEGDIHERLVYPDSIKPVQLQGDCEHYSFKTVEEHADKVDHYSSLIAAERLAKGKKFSVPKMLFSPLATFFKFYIIKAGFLDGTFGFIIAIISAYDSFLRNAKMKS